MSSIIVIIILASVLIVFIAAFKISSIRGRKKEEVERQIRSNPVYIEAELLDVDPGAPSRLGVVSLRLSYRFSLPDGKTITRTNVNTAVKTLDLHDFKNKKTIEVMYLQDAPEKNMLVMKNAAVELLNERLQRRKSS